MTCRPKKHQRRSIRLRGYDYAEAGWYFVTTCTHGHACLFGRIAGEQMLLSEAGRMVQAAWEQLSDHYPRVATDALVVMPNHIHGIIVLLPVGAGPRACPNDAPSQTVAQDGKGQPQGAAPTSGGPVLSLPDVVHRFKTFTTRQYIIGVRRHGWPAFARRLWQRNYYEHIIRNERSLDLIRQYIVGNPARWAYDRENPEAQRS